VPPFMTRPISSTEILEEWARKPLDFDPGTKWQYSNTNYVIAGVIVEKVSGQPLMNFLQQNVFTPLNMTSVYNTDVAKLGDTDAAGYIRYALGPLRPAPKEGAGWMFAAGELAMPAHDLALWDISMMNRSLLASGSYKVMFDSVKLKDGTDSHYALGLSTKPLSGHAVLEHSGEVSGFVSENIVFPDDKAAIVVLTNQDASSAAGAIGGQLIPIVLGIHVPSASQAEAQGLAIFKGLQQGQIDRTLFTDNCNAYFDQQAIADFSSSLKPLGDPATFSQLREDLRGGMTFRVFNVTFKDSPPHLHVTTYTMPDGKLEQYLVIPSR
jgi:D-alanyl-D-alanine carboxypeptidase